MSTLKVDNIRHNSATSDAITMASDGTCTAKLTSIGGGGLSHRNLIINGAMTISQRGTSSTTNGYAALDRYRNVYSGTDEAPTQSQVDVAAGTTPYTLGFRKALKITNGNQTGGAGVADSLQIWQRIESQNIANSGWNYLSSSSFVTLQFWIKSSIAQNFQGYLLNEDSSQNTFPFETGSLTANTWTKVTKVVSGNSNLVFNNDNGAGLRVAIVPFLGTDSTSNSLSLDTWTAYNHPSNFTKDCTTTWYTTNDATLEITGLQLEVGDTATTFEHRSYGEELIRCQRYCMKWWNHGEPNNNHSRFPPGYYQNSTNGVFFLFHSVPMRATDSRSITHNIGNIESMSGGGNSSSLSIMTDGASNMITPIVVGGLSGVTQHAIYLARVGNGQTNWYIIVSSEI